MTPPPGLPRPPADRLYLGWQYATPHPDPGPPPRRPVPPEREQLSATWLAAQQREENLISRPLRIGSAVAVAVVLALLITVAGGWVPVVIAAPAIAVCLLAAGLSGYVIWQGKRVLGVRVAAERQRVEQFRADQESRLFAWQAQHARQVSQWQRQRFAYREPETLVRGFRSRPGSTGWTSPAARWPAGRRCSPWSPPTGLPRAVR